MDPKGFAAIVNFKLGCLYSSLPVQWGQPQVKAFPIYIHVKFYTTAYLIRMWNTITKLAELFDDVILEENEQDYQAVKDQAKEIKDNKVPISKELLEQLCTAVDKCFKEYKALLAKTLFLLAWGGFMRICKYSRISDGNQHNIRANAVLTSDLGVRIAFHSDMTSKGSHPICHRFVEWHQLPQGAQKVIESYKATHPAREYNFFCSFDGLELTRPWVLNFLEACLLQTDWVFLSVTPHCFCVGAASNARVIGVPISEVSYIGRWINKRKAIEAYIRLDMIALSPAVIHQELPHYHRACPEQRILFISRSVIETPGSVLHPHHRAVARNFPELLNHPDMPLFYPHPSAVERMDNVIAARESGVYLNHFVFELEQKQKEIAHRGEVAN